MCGIAGQLRFDGRAVDPAVIERMSLALLHRGPDDGGVWTSGAVGLGSRRLAVIDLSPRGHMPMHSADGALSIAYNGEIYNFQSLRAELERDGHTFVSDSDTEVILKAYEEFGPSCVTRLRGMFALAIWDARRQQLMIARDRLGKKPCFYLPTPAALWFASEPRVLLQDPEVGASVDPAAIHQFLSLGYVPGPGSAFRQFRKLPPGHYLLVDREGRQTLKRYWNPEDVPVRPIGHEEAADQLLAHLEEAVRLRLIADVPVGAFLSGGIDSSLIVALMRRVSTGPVRTFSIGFESEDFNELAHARTVARHCDTEHREFIVKPDAAAILPRLVWHYSEPFGDSSALPSFYLSEMARTDVTVALNGDGGDEAFLGYDRYRAAALAASIDGLPALVRRGLAWPRHLLPVRGTKSAVTRMSRLLEGLPLTEGERYARWMSIFTASDVRRLYTTAFADAVADVHPLRSVAAAVDGSSRGSAPERAAAADIATYLPDDLLVKMDIASMAHSLELRSPLLDHVVVEFAASLPLQHKLQGATQKRILRTLAARLLPPEIVSRPKAGFGVPLEHWLRGPMQDFARAILLDPVALRRGYFRPEAVAALVDDHVTARANNHSRIWLLLVLEIWHRLFVDARPSPAPPALHSL